jgi:hypothetical protein
MSPPISGGGRGVSVNFCRIDYNGSHCHDINDGKAIETLESVAGEADANRHL